MKDTRPRIETTEDELAFSHHGGRASAFEDAAKLALDQACHAFGNCRDHDAKVLREFAQTLAELGKRERLEQEKFS